MGGGFCGNGRRRPPARCCPAPPSITPAPSNRHRPCPTPPSTMSAQKKHRHPRLRGDDGREGVWRWAKGGSDRGAGCDGAVMAGVGPAVFAPLSPPSGGHGRRRPCRFRPAPTTIGRSCQAPPSPRSTPPPPPSSPRRRGSTFLCHGRGLWGTGGAWGGSTVLDLRVVVYNNGVIAFTNAYHACQMRVLSGEAGS